MKNIFNKFKKKISIIDLVIIAIFSIALLLFILVFRRETTYITLRLKVTDPDIQQLNIHPFNEYAYSIVDHDKEINEIGETISEILSVDAYRTEPDKQVIYVDMRVKSVYSPRQKKYTVKGKPVTFGQSLTFSLSKAKFEGIVVDFPGLSDTPIQNQKMIVKAQIRENSRTYSDTYGVPAYLANAIKIGDEIKNSKGETLVKIIDVTIQPAKRTIVTNAGSSMSIIDQELKDVFFTVEITAFKKNNHVYMFDYLPIFIGQLLPLNFPSITIWPTIISME